MHLHVQIASQLCHQVPKLLFFCMQAINQLKMNQKIDCQGLSFFHQLLPRSLFTADFSFCAVRHHLFWAESLLLSQFLCLQVYTFNVIAHGEVCLLNIQIAETYLYLF